MNDTTVSGVLINNGTMLMSYHDYQTILDSITLKLGGSSQHIKEWVRQKYRYCRPYWICHQIILDPYKINKIDITLKHFLCFKDITGINSIVHEKNKSENTYNKSGLGLQRKWIISSGKNGVVKNKNFNTIAETRHENSVRTSPRIILQQTNLLGSQNGNFVISFYLGEFMSALVNLAIHAAKPINLD